MVLSSGTLPFGAMSLQEKFGRNVRYWRKKRGLTQEDLAGRAAVHVTYLSGIENARRNATIDVIGRLAKALHLEPAELFTPTSEAD